MEKNNILHGYHVWSMSLDTSMDGTREIMYILGNVLFLGHVGLLNAC